MIVRYEVVDNVTGEILKTGVCPEETVPMQVDDPTTQTARIVTSGE